MIEHLVLFKFGTQTTKEQKDETIRKLKALNEIDGIVDLQAGYNFSKRNKGYEIGLTVRFVDKQSLERYGPHPKHQDLVAYLKEIGVEDTLVVDFEI